MWPLRGASTGLLALILGIQSVHAETLDNDVATRPMVFQNLGIKDGLSQSTVNAIHEDSRGFIWLGTENGLNRYDGHQILRYMRHATDSPGLDSDFIWAIAEDANNDLWLASEGAGLIHWERRSGRFRSLPMPQDPASRRGRCLLIDKRGHIWMGTRGAGLLEFDPQGQLLRQIKASSGEAQLRADTVSALAPMDEQTLLLGTDAGLQLLHLPDGRIKPLEAPAIAISSLLIDHQQNIWAGSFEQGLLRLKIGDDQTQHFRHAEGQPDSLSSDQVRSLLQDANRRIWVATQDGLNRFRPRDGGFEVTRREDKDPYSLADNRLMSLHQGADGMLWVGSRLGGVDRWNPRSWTLGAYSPDAMQGAAVLAFADAGNAQTWVGGFGMPLLKVDSGGEIAGAFDTAHGYPELPAAPVSALLRDGDQRLWIGTMNHGLHVYDPAQGRLLGLRDKSGAGRLPADGIMSLHQASDGRIWVGSFGAGSFSLNPRTLDAMQHMPPGQNELRVTAIRSDAHGQIWMGTDGSGLYRLHTGHEAWTHIQQPPQGIAIDTVFALHSDSAGGLWVGTAGAGLAYLEPAQLRQAQPRFRHWTTAHGLSNNVINGIREDRQGYIWLSSNSGLMRLDPKTEELRYFHRAQGLQSEEFNFGAHHASADGRLFFGGSGGYNAFDPASLDRGRAPPRLALTGIEVLNQPWQAGTDYQALEQLELAHDENVLTLSYAALDFAEPARNRYSVMLQGFDRDWSPASLRHRSTYTNLDPGHYVFRVRAATSDGYWSQDALELPIIVHAPPWATPQAYLAYAVISISLLFLFLRWRLRGLEREAHIRQLAYYDKVTGLPNRDMFSARLNDAIRETGDNGDKLCVICLRLGALHHLQDSLGYQSLDDVLRALSPRLTQLLFGQGPAGSRRDLARLSEHEFIAFIALEDPQTQGSMWARRLCEALKKPLYFGDHQVRISAHAGIAGYPQDGSGDALIQAASTAARDASERGDDQFAFYDPVMTSRARERLQLEGELRSAIEHSELNLFLQGKFDAQGRLVGAEALSRWQHPERGAISPGLFVPLAEESDLILELDTWVLGQACRYLQRWDEQGYPPISIAVNVSAETFASGRIFTALQECHDRYAIDPARLEIEITETVLASDIALLTKSLNRLKALGHKLSLDDFGTGYSSLTYLQQFPIDKLKIDQAFVRDLEQNPDQQALCTAIISLAGSLRMQTIAEGVENAAQKELLLNLGCDQIQGFFLHRPQAVDEFTAALMQTGGQAG